MAQRIASQKRMLSSVIVTFRIILTIKRSIRKPAMTETAVTTCGVTIFEISQMTPITMESRIASSMKRVQPKRRTCLGEVGCCLFLSVLFDASALMKARCVDILIHDDCIHIGAFNSSRAITRYSASHELLRAMLEKSQVFVQTLGVWSGAFILALDTTKAPDGVTSSHVLTIDCWQTINLDEQNDCSCQFGVEFIVLWTRPKVVCQFILVENALHSLILQKHWC